MFKIIFCSAVLFLFHTPIVTSLNSVNSLPKRNIKGDVCGVLESRKLYLEPGKEIHLFAKNVTYPHDYERYISGLGEMNNRLRRFASPETRPLGSILRSTTVPERPPESGIEMTGNQPISPRMQRLNNGSEPVPVSNLVVQSSGPSTLNITSSIPTKLSDASRNGTESLPDSNTRTFISNYITTSSQLFSLDKGASPEGRSNTSTIEIDRRGKNPIDFPPSQGEFDHELLTRQRPQLRCHVELFTCNDCHLEFRIVKLNLEFCSYDKSCRCDYVRLQEPTYPQAQGLDVCNQEDGITTNYISQTRHVTLDFLYSKSYQDSFDISVKSKRNIFHVVDSLSNSSGLVTTPFFPESYPSDHWMEYTFRSKNSSIRIKVSFLDFNISPWSFVEVLDTNKIRVATFHGNIFRPPVLVSSGTNLAVRFTANGETERGFKMQYDFVTAGSVESHPPITDCGGHVTNSGGVILMMNMSSSSNASTLFDCIWIIQAPRNYIFKSHLSVKVAQFLNMGPSSVLEVHRGLTSEDFLLERIEANDFSAGMTKEHSVSIEAGFYVRVKASFKKASKLAIVYSTFSYFRNCYASTDFLCLNRRCIPKRLRCDGFDHCGDRSDEPASCYHGERENDSTGRPQASWWYGKTSNYFFPERRTFLENFHASGILLLFCVFVLMLVIVGLLFYLFGQNIYGSERSRRRRRHNRDHAAISDIVEIFDASDDDPPAYEAPPGYDEGVKMMLSGNNLKLVRRPGGITAWVSNIPVERSNRTPRSREERNDRVAVGSGGTGAATDLPVLRTRHSSLGAGDRVTVVLWSSDPTTNEIGENRATSLPALHSIPNRRRPSSSLGVDDLGANLPNQMGLEADGREPGTSFAGNGNDDEVLMNLSVRRSKCESLAPNEAPPPSYEETMGTKPKPPVQLLSKSEGKFGVKSSSIRRSSRQRRSTFLRVKAAREMFQKLARGEELAVEGYVEAPGLTDTLSSEGLMIVRGTVQKKKEMLLNGACSCSSVVQEPVTVNYNYSDYINLGPVTSSPSGPLETFSSDELTVVRGMVKKKRDMFQEGTNCSSSNLPDSEVADSGSAPIEAHSSVVLMIDRGTVKQKIGMLQQGSCSCSAGASVTAETNCCDSESVTRGLVKSKVQYYLAFKRDSLEKRIQLRPNPEGDDDRGEASKTLTVRLRDDKSRMSFNDIDSSPHHEDESRETRWHHFFEKSSLENLNCSAFLKPGQFTSCYSST